MKSEIVNKRSLLLSALLIFALNTLTFAQTLKDVFTSSETQIMYLGLDYTKAKLIDDANANVMDIKERQYAGINELVVTESKKFDLKSAFHKSFVDHDLGPVTKSNEKINAEEIKSTNTSDFHRLQATDIDGVVRGLDFAGQKGVIGLLFVVEGMSKSEKAAAVWVTLIDMRSKKVLMTERMLGKTSMGFGFRNFWAAPIKNIIDEIEKKKYEEWKSKYGH